LTRSVDFNRTIAAKQLESVPRVERCKKSHFLKK
jgi:hypothetical protein